MSKALTNIIDENGHPVPLAPRVMLYNWFLLMDNSVSYVFEYEIAGKKYEFNIIVEPDDKHEVEVLCDGEFIKYD